MSALQTVPSDRFYQEIPATPVKGKKPPELKSTPISRGHTSTEPLTSNPVHQHPARAEAGMEMKNKFQEVSTCRFLDLLPDFPGMPDVNYALFQSVAKTKKEVDMYDPFIEAMIPYLKKGWALVNTSTTPDNETCKIWLDHDIKPDMALYESARQTGERLCDASEMVCCGEFKMSKKDEPFRTTTYRKRVGTQKKVEGSKDCQEPCKRTDFERQTQRGQNTRGQLTLYINAIQATQQRTHVFAFYVRKQYCRLLCHTRSGMVVTPLIDYTQTSDMQSFFWRLTHAERADRGFDTTSEPVGINDPHAATARAHLQLEARAPLFRVSVNTLSDDTKYYYVSEPFTFTHVYPVGRGTRCYCAYDPARDNVVFLKDTWRVDVYIPEHETYAMLHMNNVPNIPTVLAAGDVEGRWQRCGDTGLRGSHKRIHRHYRIVLLEVGRPLREFRSTHELVSVISDAFLAHKKAHEVGILHRDVSYGNIIIMQGRGYLIDWEMARLRTEEGARVCERTGTWQFLSIRLLKDAEAFHEASDDIESFIYILLWVAAKYAPNTLSAGERAKFLRGFDYDNLAPWTHKGDFRNSTIWNLCLETLPFEELLTDLVEHLRFRYDERLKFKTKGMSDGEAKELRKRLITHEWMENTLEAKLKNDEWKKMKDNTVIYPVAQDTVGRSEFTKKRKADIAAAREEQEKKRIRTVESVDSYTESYSSDGETEDESDEE